MAIATLLPRMETTYLNATVRAVETWAGFTPNWRRIGRENELAFSKMSNKKAQVNRCEFHFAAEAKTMSYQMAKYDRQSRKSSSFDDCSRLAKITRAVERSHSC